MNAKFYPHQKRVSCLLLVLMVFALLASACAPSNNSAEAAQQGETPVGVVEAFYNSYLDYARPDGQGNFRNPLVDRIYRNSPYLDNEFVQRIDQLLAGGIRYDPFLQAQDIASDFVVEPCPEEEACALVTLNFGGSFNRHLKVDLAQDVSTWKITNIEPLE